MRPEMRCGITWAIMVSSGPLMARTSLRGRKPVEVGMIFGIGVAVVVGFAWLSDDHVVQKLALALLLAWASTNFVVNYFGFDQAATINPSIDAVIAIIVARVGYNTRSRLALVIFLLYVAVGALWLGAWILHQQVSRPLYDALGLLFMAQLFAVGGVGGRLALRHWLDSRRPRVRPYPLGG